MRIFYQLAVWYVVLIIVVIIVVVVIAHRSCYYWYVFANHLLIWVLKQNKKKRIKFEIWLGQIDYIQFHSIQSDIQVDITTLTYLDVCMFVWLNFKFLHKVCAAIVSLFFYCFLHNNLSVLCKWSAISVCLISMNFT